MVLKCFCHSNQRLRSVIVTLLLKVPDMIKKSFLKVVIVGGGFGGLNAAKKLVDSTIEVVLIDRTNHHLFQPLLYQVASAALSPADIANPIRQILNNQKNTSVMMGEVVSIKKEQQQILLKTGEHVHYDILILAVGARHSYFGKPEWESYAPGIKTLADAIRIRERILTSFERAERSRSFAEAQKYLNFVVIGGGPTGVELAGALAEIAHKTLIKDFRRINLSLTKIYLIESLPRILTAFPESLSKKAEETLKKMGVEVVKEKKVVEITEEGVFFENSFIPTANVLWAAGNQAAPVLKSLDLPLDRQGRVIVDSDLSVPGHPEIFVIGDAAAVSLGDNKTIPGIAPAAKLIKSRLPKEKRPPFRYFDKGMMATIGRAKAIVAVGRLRFSGFIAWLMWSLIHIVYLIDFRNRLLVMMEWIFWYITQNRGVRIITFPLDEYPNE
jgi:NADH:ubiquinone reductase (H+-translocating)